jgi:Tol biopolymer transport system component
VLRGRRIGGFVAASALLTCLLAPAPGQAAFPGANGKIAFTESGNGSRAYTINPDGTGRIALANGRDPAWSADGRKIAYINLSNHLATMNADGSGQTDLGVGPDLSGDRVYVTLRNPAWSPDGTQIAFVEGIEIGDANFSTLIEVVNSDGSGRRRLFTGGGIGNVPRPSWSPDGEWIVFDDYCDPPDYPAIAICRIHPDGTGLSSLFLGSTDSYTPDWSPDGSSIVFGYGGVDWIAKVGADGSGFQIVREGNPSAASSPAPAWSPDGSKIAFTLGGYPGGSVYLMNADGSGAASLTSGYGPSWQPIPNRPPDCSSVAASRPVLTIANHRLVAMTLDGATDPDGDALTIAIDSVTQDEPVESGGDSTSPDAIDDGDGEVKIRAERDRHGDGRVYRIAFTATDGRGASCSGTTTVSVPRKRHKAAIDSAPPSYDSFAR